MDSLVKMTDMTWYDRQNGWCVYNATSDQPDELYNMDWRIWYSNTEPVLSHLNGSRSTGRSRPGLPPEFGLGGLPPLPARRWAADGSQPFDGDVHPASATGESGRHGLWMGSKWIKTVKIGWFLQASSNIGWLRAKMTNGWVWIFKHAWSFLKDLERLRIFRSLYVLSSVSRMVDSFVAEHLMDLTRRAVRNAPSTDGRHISMAMFVCFFAQAAWAIGLHRLVCALKKTVLLPSTCLPWVDAPRGQQTGDFLTCSLAMAGLPLAATGIGRM